MPLGPRADAREPPHKHHRGDLRTERGHPQRSPRGDQKGAGRPAAPHCFLRQDWPGKRRVRHQGRLRRALREADLSPSARLWHDRRPGQHEPRGAELGAAEAEGEGRQPHRAGRCADVAARAHQGLPHAGQGAQRGLRLGASRAGVGQGQRGAGRAARRAGSR